MRIRYLLMTLLACACAREPLRDRTEAVRLSEPPQTLADDLEMGELIASLESTATFLESPQANRLGQIQLGAKSFSRPVYAKALRYLARKTTEAGGDAKETFHRLVRENFDFYEVYGDSEGWGEVFITSYYEPILKGSAKPTAALTQPLYKMPEDLVEIPLSRWPATADPGGARKTLIGRLTKEKAGSGAGVVQPFWSRKEIDAERALEKRKLELAYVDPIDSFFLQIQGSGTVEMDDGRSIRVGYAAQNGHKYEPVGAFLKDQIPIEKMSMHTIEAHLRGLPKEQAQDVMNKNPSYVFFKELKTAPITYMGVPVVAGRTIATDTRYFPKGALAYLEFDKPSFADAAATEPAAWTKTSRYVLDQDKGGAINGGGRLDLFWGSGPSAKQAAGVMKNRGRLYYLAPKDTLVAALAQIDPMLPVPTVTPDR